MVAMVRAAGKNKDKVSETLKQITCSAKDSHSSRFSSSLTMEYFLKVRFLEAVGLMKTVKDLILSRANSTISGLSLWATVYQSIKQGGVGGGSLKTHLMSHQVSSDKSRLYFLQAGFWGKKI